MDARPSWYGNQPRPKARGPSSKMMPFVSAARSRQRKTRRRANEFACGAARVRRIAEASPGGGRGASGRVDAGRWTLDAGRGTLDAGRGTRDADADTSGLDAAAQVRLK
jgi:hypothetical protein